MFQATIDTARPWTPISTDLQIQEQSMACRSGAGKLALRQRGKKCGLHERGRKLDRRPARSQHAVVVFAHFFLLLVQYLLLLSVVLAWWKFQALRATKTGIIDFSPVDVNPASAYPDEPYNGPSRQEAIPHPFPWSPISVLVSNPKWTDGPEKIVVIIPVLYTKFVSELCVNYPKSRLRPTKSGERQTHQASRTFH